MPYFQKKEDVLNQLYVHGVCASRAGWYIRLLGLYELASAEQARLKKRQALDLSISWALVLAKY